MPWSESSVISLRREFVQLAASGENISRLSRRFGISRKTGYKWIERHEFEGEAGLSDRSRRPTSSPGRVCGEMEEAIIAVRKKHPSWGGRKIRRRLLNLAHANPPAASTITAILSRNGLLNEEDSNKRGPFERFQRSTPNDLWQMDFKGHVGCPEGRCHPLTILDDHSRFSVGLFACLDESGETVTSCLQKTFQVYGLPNQMITDNGSPWGNDPVHPLTRLTLWLIRLGVLIAHSRPAHPQTMGKDERFHRTLKAELLGDWVPWTNRETQKRFDEWRYCYNYDRPHEALHLDVPGKLYTISKHSFPDTLPPIEYGPDDIIRKVQQGGWVHFHGRAIRIPKGLAGQPVALRPRSQNDGRFAVYYVRQFITEVDLNDHDDI